MATSEPLGICNDTLGKKNPHWLSFNQQTSHNSHLLVRHLRAFIGDGFTSVWRYFLRIKHYVLTYNALSGYLSPLNVGNSPLTFKTHSFNTGAFLLLHVNVPFSIDTAEDDTVK